MKFILSAGAFLCVLFLPSTRTFAQVAAVRFTVLLPGPPDSGRSVYISGSFNYWHAGDSLYRMEKLGDRLYSIALPLFDGKKYTYKYTLGGWDRVEVGPNDSNRENRVVFSRNGGYVSDTVAKWMQPHNVSIFSNAQLQKINSMKDSVLGSLKPSLADMQQLLKNYVYNLLKDRPSLKVQKQLDRQAEKKLDNAYTQITRLLWNVMATLTPEQKEAIRNRLSQPAGQKDFLNTFTGSFQGATSGK